MSNMTRTTGMIAAALAAAYAAQADEDDAVETPALDELPEPDLGAITRYTFGDNRLALTAVHKLVTDTLKSGAKEQQKLAKELADLLNGATTDAKLFLCRELARIAGEREVKTLAALLDDAETADMARYALHPIPGDAVEKELARKLKKADKALVLAVLKTLGERAHRAGEDTLKKYAGDKDPDVAALAQAALARLG